MTLIHLSEKARDAFFAHLVKQTVLERIRGGNSLCYEPPQSQLATDERANTYSSGSLSRGNNPALRSKQSWNISNRKPITSFLTSSSDRLMSLSPTHTYRSEAFAEDLVDELNYGGNK